MYDNILRFVETEMKKRFFLLAIYLLVFCFVPLNVAYATEKWVNILAFFGTSMPEAKQSLDALEKAYVRTGDEIIVAYTSDIIRKKLKKNGQEIFSVNEALNQAHNMGYKKVRIQSFHVGAAEEFYNLQRMIVKNLIKNPMRFDSVLLGYPLMASGQDLMAVRDILLNSLPKEREKNQAVIFMGHGNHHGPGDIMLYALEKALQEKDPFVYVAAVEGNMTFDNVLSQLKQNNIKHAWLQPFMVVAGDHARNDMAGSEPDSWVSQLQAANIKSSINLIGLGDIKGIQDIFLRHTKTAYDDLTKSKKSD